MKSKPSEIQKLNEEKQTAFKSTLFKMKKQNEDKSKHEVVHIVNQAVPSPGVQIKSHGKPYMWMNAISEDSEMITYEEAGRDRIEERMENSSQYGNVAMKQCTRFSRHCTKN